MKRKNLLPLSLLMIMMSATIVSADEKDANILHTSEQTQIEVQADKTSAVQFKYSVNIDNTITIDGLAAGQTDSAIDLVIPESINGKRIKAIAVDAFSGNKEIRSVVLNEGLETIGEGAFRNCVNLTGTLIVPSTVTCVGTYEGFLSFGSFEGTALEKVIFKEGTENLTINARAFTNCNSLTEVKFPARLTEIGGNSFANDILLADITFTEGKEALSIGDYAFQKTAIKDMVFTANTKSIGLGAFKGCGNLLKVVFNDGIEQIGGEAFMNCEKLGGVITIPSSVTQLGSWSLADYGAFENTNIFGVEIEDAATQLEIGTNTFSGCKNLRYADLSSRVSLIRDNAFNGTENLVWVKLKKSNYELKILDAFENSGIQYISIPKKTSIAEWAFYECKNLKNVYYVSSQSDYKTYVTVEDKRNDAYKNASFTYNYTAYDTWPIPQGLTGLVLDTDGVWKYYKDGGVDTTYTGLASNEYGWFYVENGMINWNYTGLTEYNGTWFYVENGVLNWGYIGLVEYNGIWFYINGGVIDWNYTGLVEYAGTWFYVNGGILDWSYTGLASNEYGWFYVQGGVLNWSYNGLVEYAGTWFYVTGGFIDWSTTTVTEYNGYRFYVENSMINWNYTGYYMGYNIVNGIAYK